MSEIIRTCVCCRTQKDKRDMIRVVRNKDGNVFIDDTHGANGRGAYVCKSKKCLAKAVKSGVLAAQLNCQIPEEIKQSLSEIDCE